MFETGKKYWLFFLTFLIVIFVSSLFYIDWQVSHRVLKFAMLDIGQGDALFIESPTGTQIMFDAGSQHTILGPLARVMSPFDKSIDAIVITNPDSDHIGGFLDILKNYRIAQVFEPGTLNDSKTYQDLEFEIKNQKIPDILLKRGMRLDIGGGAVIDILFPDRDVTTWSSNDGSVIAKLMYGNTSIMLTGDATKKTESIVVSGNSPAALKSTILKVGHHGSYTSTGQPFLEAVSPTYALISDGKNNKYGHPHPDTLNTLTALGVKIFRTDLLGTIIMKSEGKNPLFSFHQ